MGLKTTLVAHTLLGLKTTVEYAYIKLFRRNNVFMEGVYFLFSCNFKVLKPHWQGKGVSLEVGDHGKAGGWTMSCSSASVIVPPVNL